MAKTFEPKTTLSADSNNSSLFVDDTADYLGSPSEAANVPSAVVGLGSTAFGGSGNVPLAGAGLEGGGGTVTVSDTPNPQSVADVASNGNYSAGLSTLADGAVTSSLLVGDPASQSTGANGNVAPPDTDNGLTPTLSVNAENPADVVFTVSGLGSGYSGTVTFTDSANKSDVVAIKGNGTYSANLSNLADGSLTYLLKASDPAGNVITVDPTTTLGLPPGVTLQPINGGPDYYANNGFTYAANAGWDNPSFFAIGPFEEAVTSEADVTLWHGLNWNTAFNIQGNFDLALAGASTGIWVIQNISDGLLPGTGAETVGLLTYDEPSTFAEGVTTPLSTTANSIQDGRFWYINDTWNFIAYGGLSPVNSSAQVLDTLVTTPNGTQVHIDASSIDAYWFSGANTSQMQGELGLIDNLGGNATAAEVARGSNYGDIITDEEAITGGSQPIFGFVETGGPYTQDTSASDYITPAELNWAVWSELIHGANGIDYFDHSFAGPAVSDSNVQDAYYQTVQPGQTVSIYTQIQQTDALVTQLAPVLNSPTALGYVTVNNAAYENGTILSPFGGIEVMAKDDNGQFYIFADTADALTQTNIAATFTIADTNATSVTVVGENRTIPVVDGVFSDTFATAATVHIYEVIDGNPAPVISTGLENSNASVTLTGTAPDGSTVTVSDGGATALGTATASSSGAWSFTTADLAAGSYAFTATDTTSAGTSGASSPFDAVVTNPANPAVSSIAKSPSSGDLDAGKTVTLTLTFNELVNVTGAPTLTLNDGGSATYSSGSGSSALTFSYTVAAGQNTSSLAITSVNLPTGTTITNSGGAAAELSLTGLTQSGPQIDTTPPAAPVISGDTVSSNTVTLTGTAAASNAITVFDNSTQLGTATTNSSGAWTFTTGALANGSQSFTATAADGAGNVSPLSSALAMTLTAPLVANGNFGTDSFSGWTLGGNYTDTTYGPEIFIDTDAEGGSTYAAGMGSVGADGTLSQTIATTAGQTYTLSFWLQNEAGGTNDFKAIWNGQTLLSRSNAAQSGYTEYTYTVTATGSTTSLEFSAANGPSQWDLDNVSLTANSTPPADPPAAPVISTGVANSNESVTLTGTAPDGSTVTVSDGGTTALGTATASSSGAWSFTTADLSAASYAFTATDTTSAGTSAASSAFDVTVPDPPPPPDPPTAPVISTGVANSNESVTLKGTAPDGSTVTVSDGGATALGTATASSSGAWSFTTADLAAGSYAFTATDTTSAGTSAASSAFDVTVPPPPPAAPVISTGVANSNESVILTGTAPDGSTVTVSDGGATALGTATASSTGTWSFTTADLAAGSYAFTATDTTSAGTSAASSPFDVTVPDPPTAPVISTGVANSNESVTLKGTAPDGSTVTVSDGGATALGTATASSTGTWSFTTADLSAGSYAFTATDATSAGTSAASSPFDVTVTSSSPPPSGSNLVANGNFATDSFSGWTLGGNSTSTYYGPEIFIDTDAEGGSTYAAGMGSVGSDGTLSQTIATTAGQTYTLSFWLQNEESGTNDFKAIWNGQTLLSLSNAAQSGYTEYTYTVMAAGSTTTLEFSAANGPSQWDLDNVSLTANSTPPPAAPVISTGVENSNASVTLTGTAPDGSTVTVSDGGTTALGTATANSTGAWSFTTAHLSARSYAFTATDTISAGNVSTASSPLNVKVNANLIGAVTIGTGATLELAAADSASVTFNSSTGTLILESPSTFSGKIYNFTGNGSLSGSDQIDLTNINFNSVKDSYANGVLTVTDGTKTDKLGFNGSYKLANFDFASDGSGGTIVYDPPVPTSNALAPTSSGQTSGGQGRNFTGTGSGFEAQDVFDLPGIAFDAQATLGYLPGSNRTEGTLPFMDGAQSAKIALLGSYMASSFATVGDHHSDSTVTEAWQASNQSLLTHPQHA